MIEAALVIAVIGVLIPLINALATTLHAAGWVKTAVALVLAALGAVGASLADVHGLVSWKGMLTTFLLSLVAAGGSRLSWLSSVEQVIALKFPNLGVGVKGAPEVDHDYPKP